MKKLYDGDAFKKRLKSKKSMITMSIMEDWEIDVNELELSKDAKDKYLRGPPLGRQQSSEKMKMDEMEDIAEEDIESELSEMLDKLVINPKIRYNEIVASPKVFVDFLKSKLVPSNALIT